MDNDPQVPELREMPPRPATGHYLRARHRAGYHHHLLADRRIVGQLGWH